jgi:hypothetical protein
MAGEVCDPSSQRSRQVGHHHPMAYGQFENMTVKRFSKIKETDNQFSKLRLCFEFIANKNPVADLHAVGLLASSGSFAWHGGKKWRHMGRAYILTDRKQDLEAAQDKLRQMGWQEMPEE